jgi:hypothetical protein
VEARLAKLVMGVVLVVQMVSDIGFGEMALVAGE